MEQQKRLLFKAMKRNWGLLCAFKTEWSNTTWKIYDDGSYEWISEFVGFHTLTWSKSGKMDDDQFAKLRSLIETDQWRDPARKQDGCDGTGWQMESYKEDGSLDKTSGKTDYIYGEEVLESIAALLPVDEYTFKSPLDALKATI